MKNKMILIVLSTLMLVSAFNTFAVPRPKICVRCHIVIDCWWGSWFCSPEAECEDIECPPPPPREDDEI